MLEVGHGLCGIAVEHVANREREHEPVVVAAAERRIEEEVAGFLEARHRADLVDAALHVGVAGLPVVDLDAVRAQHRVGHEQAGRLHVGDEGRALVLRGDVAREHHAHLVGENFLALVVDHAAAVAVAVEAERHVRLDAQHLVAHRVQHLHVFGVGIVFGESVIELAVERDDLAADGGEDLRRKRAGGAVAAGANDLEAALELRARREIGDVTGREVLDEGVGATAAQVKARLEHDRLEPIDLVRAEGERASGAHLHAGPAVVVVGSGHHRHARHVESELGEIRHRGDRQADVADVAARRHQPRHQGGLHRGRIGAKIVAGHHLRRDAELVDERAEAEPQRLHPHQVDFLLQEPARVVFAKAGGLHQRLGFIGIGVGRERGLRLGEHQRFLIADRCARAS